MNLGLKPEFVKHTSETRLHSCPIPIVGLTGGIASGKSTVAKILEKNGLLIIDADQLIKRIYQRPDVLEKIKIIDPSFVTKDGPDFGKIRKWAFKNPENRQFLESVLYPYLPSEFIQVVRENKDSKFVIYDVPLLFEKSLHPLVDFIVCVYIPQELQIKRLTQRDRISEKEARAILDHQLDLEQKVARSDYSITNDSSIENLEKEINIFINKFFA